VQKDLNTPITKAIGFLWIGQKGNCNVRVNSKMCVYIYNEFAFLFTFFIFSWISFVPVLIKYW
jgi:hypothetical protein